MRTAIVHDWLVSPIGGGENVLEAIHKIFPSPIFTLVQDAKNLKGSYFENLDVSSSFIQKLPFAKTKYRNYLPLFPMAIEQFDLSGFDVILSSSHCVAKGILTHPEQIHICYCHTPIRYAWDLMHTYLREANLESGIKGRLVQMILHYLRNWDAQSSSRADYFIANSKFVASRIEKFYKRSSQVIHPPVDTDFYQCKEEKQDYYITASRLVQNKRMDLIVRAFAQIPHKKLIVIGDGPERKKLENLATANVEFLGAQSKESLKTHLQNAKAFLFAAIEDFGILPVEAMATGTPVIALGKGGTLETVVHGETGLLYPDQTEQSLLNALLEMEKMAFDPKKCRKRALAFSAQRFHQEFQDFVSDCVSKRKVL